MKARVRFGFRSTDGEISVKKLHERLWIRDLWTRVLFFVIARDFGMGHLKTFQTFTIDHKSVVMHARFMQF